MQNVTRYFLQRGHGTFSKNLKSEPQIKATIRRENCTGFLDVQVSKKVQSTRIMNNSDHKMRGTCAICGDRTQYNCFGCKIYLYLNDPHCKDMK